MVANVIGGGAVREVLQPKLVLNRLQRLEQLLLAVVAAVGVVLRVGLELELVRRDLDQSCAQQVRDVPCLLLLRLGISGRVCKHRDRTVAELVQRELQQQC